MPLREEHRSQLDRIVQQMLANGEPDESVQAVVSDFKNKYTTGEAPEGTYQDPGIMGRLKYAGEVASAVPGSAWENLKGAVTGVPAMLGTVAGATAEVGSYIGNRTRELVGLTPHYTEGTPNIDRLAGMPGALIDQLKDRYGSVGAIDQTLRTDPVGMGLDVAGVVSGANAIRKGVVSPVLRKGSDVAMKDAVAMLPETLQRQFPGMARTAQETKIPLTRAGMQEASARGADLQAQIARRAEEVSARRPAVAGALPPGREAVPLGAPPSPMGGAPALQQAQGVARIPENQIKAYQGMHDYPTVVPQYGGMPAKGAPVAVGDTVSGPGVVLMSEPRPPFSARTPPSPPAGPAPQGRVPGMIAYDDIRPEIQSFLNAEKAKHGPIDPFVQSAEDLASAQEAGWGAPKTVTDALQRQRGSYERAGQLFRQGERNLPLSEQAAAHFHKAQGTGISKAIENIDPSIRPMQKRLQDLMGVQIGADAAQYRNSPTAALTRGNNFAALARVLGASPGGMSRLSLFLQKLAGANTSAFPSASLSATATANALRRPNPDKEP